MNFTEHNGLNSQVIRQIRRDRASIAADRSRVTAARGFPRRAPLREICAPPCFHRRRLWWRRPSLRPPAAAYCPTATRTASPRSGTACHLCVPGRLSRMAPPEATWPPRRRRRRRWTAVSAARFTRRLRRPSRLRQRRATSSRWLKNRRWSPATVRDRRATGINLLVARHRRHATSFAPRIRPDAEWVSRASGSSATQPARPPARN